jgi:hypothetical protein
MNPLFGDDDDEEQSRLREQEEAALAAKRQRLKNVRSIAKEIQESSLLAETIVASVKPVEIEPPGEIYRPVEKVVCQVEIPRDPHLKKSIDRLAGRVIRHGEEWKSLAKVDGFDFLQRGIQDQTFQYFRWRTLAGIEEDFQWWGPQQFQVDPFIFLVPPPLPPFNEALENIEHDFIDEDQDFDDQEDDDIEVSINPVATESKEVAFQKWLAKEWERKLRRHFENTLRLLTLDRDSIALAMIFSIDHFRFSEPVAFLISSHFNSLCRLRIVF